ncbi:hypothetical protein [Streptomyces sp. NPDC048527]|uniref:hypothetical protein n=1 Tax=Streptomyces sp. NPDC048527 TaxID=3365568 RepID=UPI00371195A2
MDKEYAVAAKVIDMLLEERAHATGTWGPTPSATVPAVPVLSLLRGSSADHPSIQLADLPAGATAAVAGRHAGAP